MVFGSLIRLGLISLPDFFQEKATSQRVQQLRLLADPRPGLRLQDGVARPTGRRHGAGGGAFWGAAAGLWGWGPSFFFLGGGGWP